LKDGDRLRPSRLLSGQVLAPLLEHNLKRLLVEKYGLVDCDLEHEIDRNLSYHENLDNILGIHGLADQVIHYEIERELELIEKQLERRFRVDETEANFEHINSNPIMGNPVRNEMENGFDKIFDYFDLFHSEKLTATVNPVGAALEIEANLKLNQNTVGRLLDQDKGRREQKAKIGSTTIDPFHQLCTQFFRRTGNKKKILRERRKARELLMKWERILSP